MNLRSIVHEAIASAESVEYADIANSVLARLDPADYREALAAALPTFCRSVVVSQRTDGPVRPPKAAQKLPGSWKVQAIREGWQRRLSEVYATDEGNKRLGDFTHDDLIYQASICERQAKSKLSKAKGWKGLAALMDDHGVERVRDLPAEVLMTTLGAVA